MFNSHIELIHKSTIEKSRVARFLTKKSYLEITRKETVNAKDNYANLLEPKTMSLDLYTGIYIFEAIDKIIILRTLKKVPNKYVGKDLLKRAISHYFNIFPDAMINAVNSEIYNLKFEEREKKLYELDLPLIEIEEKFKELTKARINDVKEKEGKAYKDFVLSNDKAPEEDYQEFIENYQKLINFSNENLLEIEIPYYFYEVFNNPCFYCRINTFPFSNREEVINFMEQEFPLLKKFKSKIKIIDSDHAYSQYMKDDDTFIIALVKDELFKHEVTTIMHELMHVQNMLEDFSNNVNPYLKGKYQSELEVISRLMPLLYDKHSQLFKSELVNILQTLTRTLFELEIYYNPNQDLGKLYAETYNKCFLKANQKYNPQYFLDYSIVMSPLKSLKYSIAYYQSLKKYF